MVDLNDDEYYIEDLIDMEVFDENDQKIGFIKDVLEYDVNDVYVVQTEDDEIMIPAVKEFILSVNLSENKIKVKLIEGM